MASVARKPIEHYVLNQRLIWMLYRGDGKASLAVPSSFHDMFPPGILVSSPDALADIEGRPVDGVVTSVVRFIEENSSWHAAFSVLSVLPGADATRLHLESKGWRRLDPSEVAQLRHLGLDVPLGEWIDESMAAIYAAS